MCDLSAAWRNLLGIISSGRAKVTYFTELQQNNIQFHNLISLSLKMRMRIGMKVRIKIWWTDDTRSSWFINFLNSYFLKFFFCVINLKNKDLLRNWFIHWGWVMLQLGSRKNRKYERNRKYWKKYELKTSYYLKIVSALHVLMLSL